MRINNERLNNLVLKLNTTRAVEDYIFNCLLLFLREPWGGRVLPVGSLHKAALYVKARERGALRGGGLAGF
jgi:hypothetical protein